MTAVQTESIQTITCYRCGSVIRPGEGRYNVLPQGSVLLLDVPPPIAAAHRGGDSVVRQGTASALPSLVAAAAPPPR